MTKKKRTTVRLNDLIDSKVEVLMQFRSFTNFTAYLEQLIRDDWDERATPEMEAWLARLLKNVPAPTPKRTGAAAASSDEASSRARSHNRAETGSSRKPRKFPKG